MHWIFLIDIMFYSFLGFLTLPLVVLVVANLKNSTFNTSYDTLAAFLEKWSSIDKKGIAHIFRAAGGVSAICFILAFGAYVSNRIGDSLLPRSAALFEYFGSQEVRWSVESEKSWLGLGWNYREVSGIGGDRVKWEFAKAGMGIHDVRFLRIITVMFLILSVSALIGLFRRGSRLKYSGRLIVTFLIFVGCHFMWAERQEQYIRNLASGYIDHYYVKHKLTPNPPADFPETWQGFSPAREVVNDRTETGHE